MGRLTKMRLSDEIVQTLTHKVDVVSIPQLERVWWPRSKSGRSEARRTIARLERKHLLFLVRAIVHPELTLTAPIISWQPGDPTPDFGAAAYRLQARWTKPLEPETLVCATRFACRLLGSRGKGRIHRPLQLTHDLHVTSIYLHFLQHDPSSARAWLSEASIAPERRGQKLPDAILRDPALGRDVVIEFGGSYRKERVELVHADCVRRSLAYQLW